MMDTDRLEALIQDLLDGETIGEDKAALEEE